MNYHRPAEIVKDDFLARQVELPVDTHGGDLADKGVKAVC